MKVFPSVNLPKQWMTFNYVLSFCTVDMCRRYHLCHVLQSACVCPSRYQTFQVQIHFVFVITAEGLCNSEAQSFSVALCRWRVCEVQPQKSTLVWSLNNSMSLGSYVYSSCDYPGLKACIIQNFFILLTFLLRRGLKWSLLWTVYTLLTQQ